MFSFRCHSILKDVYKRQVGYYLAKTLLEHGHTPVLIEDDPAMCRKVADSLDLTVRCV